MNISEELKKLINLSKAGYHDLVIRNCEKIIKYNDQIPEVFNIYGVALQSKGKHEEAINHFNKTILLNKNDYSAYNNLANSYKFLLNVKLAEENFLKCLNINPDYLPGIINLALVKKDLNKYNESIELFERSLLITPNPNTVKTLFTLSELHEQIGNFEKSKEIIFEILKINKNNTAAHYKISQLIDYKKNNDHHLEMLKLLNIPNLNEQDQINIFFGLGKSYESLNNYKKSFEFYSKANFLKNKITNFNFQKYDLFKKNIINFFKEIKLENLKLDKSKKIIFVCGMPRSGTTLVEQIISNHKEIDATGENLFLTNIIENNFLNDFTLDKDKILRSIESDKFYVYEKYLQYLETLELKLDILTDKSVQNFIWIGFIKIFFPNSVILNCTRNPKDIVLSIYKNNFAGGFMDWSYSQKNIANFFNFYWELINFWKDIFPGEIHDVAYEYILNNPEYEIKKIINLCELNWDPNCLNYQTNKRPVKTASFLQVRKPLYKSSINSHLHYEEYLSEMFKLMKL